LTIRSSNRAASLGADVAYLHVTTVYSTARVDIAVLPKLVSHLSLPSSGSIYYWARDGATPQTDEPRAHKRPITELTTGTVWKHFRNTKKGFVAIPSGRGRPRLDQTERFWLSVNLDDQFAQTSFVPTTCNMVQLFVSWPASGLRTEKSARSFVERVLIDMAAAGDAIGGFCTIADSCQEMGGHLFGAMTRSPKLMPYTVLREQFIGGLSRGIFVPPQHAIAMCVPFGRASAQARQAHATVAAHDHSDPLRPAGGCQFKSRRMSEHLYSEIAYPLVDILRRPMRTSAIDHSKQAVLMRSWMLD
jgi:hypothetical protein